MKNFIKKISKTLLIAPLSLIIIIVNVIFFIYSIFLFPFGLISTLAENLIQRINNL